MTTVSNRVKKLIVAINNIEQKKLFWLCFIILVFGYTLTLLEQKIAYNDLSFYKGSRSYSDIAENLVNKGKYSLYGSSPTAYRPPIYPSFLSLMMILFKDNWRVAGVSCQYILGILAGFLTLLLAKKFSKNNLVLLITVGLLISNRFFMYEVFRLRETTFYILFSLLFLYFVKTRSLSDSRIVLLALFASLSYLTKPTGLVLFAMIFIYILKDLIKSRRFLYLRKLLFFSLITIIMISPWYYYLHNNFDSIQFFPSSTVGINLYKGNNENFFSYFPLVDVDYYSPLIKQFIRQKGIGIEQWPPEEQFEHLVDLTLRKHAAKYILSNPISFILRSSAKFTALYSPIPIPLGGGKLIEVNNKIKIDRFHFRMSPTKLIGTLSCFFFILGSLLLLLRNKKYILNNNMSYILLYILLTTIIYVITFSETRFRLTLDPILIIMASIYWSDLLNSRFAQDKN